MGLGTYRKKRDFERTPEPRGGERQPGQLANSFVVQKHDASRMHHDFRLELDGVLLSWAVPKGPPTAPGDKVLAVRTEDHPLEYGGFEGVIPEQQYGGGTVMLWDRGSWRPDGDARRGLKKGKLDFELDGERLRGRWSLVRMAKKPKERAENWLLIKRSDERADARAVPPGEDRSITTGRSMREIENGTAALPLHAEALPNARPAAQPKRLAPQLATLVAEPPEGEGWLHEIKFDGYRLLAFRDGSSVRLATRAGNDWTERFPRVAAAIAALPVQRAVFDGEVVVLDERGVSDFQALQNSLDRGDSQRLALYVFDLLHCDGSDLTATPLVERKRLLESIVGEGGDGAVRFSSHVAGSGRAFFGEACKLGLEGIVSKRADSRYETRRSRSWLKTKCLMWQEFVVGGYTRPAGSRGHFGALLLGVHENGRLRYAGKVGTGFTVASLAEMAARLSPLAVASSPFAEPPRGADGRNATWVRPQCVVEVAFTGWTDGGKLRHPTFRGVREDKPAREVQRERPADAPKPKPQPKSKAKAAGAATRAVPQVDEVAGVRISNADRLLFPDAGIHKGELALYHERVAQHLLPHVEDRPLSVVRCPRGPTAKCFYQKHVTEGLPDAVRAIEVDESGGKADYIGVDDLRGIVSLVQFGALELHPWGSRRDRLDRPDRLVVDLDPGPDVPWARVVAAAHRLRELLAALGLESFVRTTGGKGLHVVLPIERRTAWPEAKQFTHDLVAALAAEQPDAYVLVATKAKRNGRIFLDYLRNDQGSTAIASYSPRARPGAPVAMPLRWDELTERTDPSAFTVTTVPDLLAQNGDAWRGFFAVEQVLTAQRRRALQRR